MKKGTLLKSLGRLPAGKVVEVSDATFARLIETGHFAKEVKVKTETKEEKHGKATETKRAKTRKANPVVDDINGATDKG